MKVLADSRYLRLKKAEMTLLPSCNLLARQQRWKRLELLGISKNFHRVLTSPNPHSTDTLKELIAALKLASAAVQRAHCRRCSIASSEFRSSGELTTFFTVMQVLWSHLLKVLMQGAGFMCKRAWISNRVRVGTCSRSAVILGTISSRLYLIFRGPPRFIVDITKMAIQDPTDCGNLDICTPSTGLQVMTVTSSVNKKRRSLFRVGCVSSVANLGWSGWDAHRSFLSSYEIVEIRNEPAS